MKKYFKLKKNWKKILKNINTDACDKIDIKEFVLGRKHPILFEGFMDPDGDICVKNSTMVFPSQLIKCIG